MGTYSVRARGRRELVGSLRNLVTAPGVIAIDDRAPSSRGGGGEKYVRR
jgi:hypothetical protein